MPIQEVPTNEVTPQASMGPFLHTTQPLLGSPPDSVHCQALPCKTLLNVDYSEHAYHDMWGGHALWPMRANVHPH